MPRRDLDPIDRSDARTAREVVLMIGWEIRASRLTLGLTQEQLAERIGLFGKQTISQWERGVRKPQGPSVKLLERLLAEADATKQD
jgi:transcriptional regulator with XRE-family HTH domain